MPNKTTDNNKTHDPSSPIEIIKTTEEITNKWVGRESNKKDDNQKQNSNNSDENLFTSWKYNF